MLTFPNRRGGPNTSQRQVTQSYSSKYLHTYIRTYIRTVGQAEEGGGVHNIYFWILIKSIKPIIKQEQEEEEDQGAAQ